MSNKKEQQKIITDAIISAVFRLAVFVIGLYLFWWGITH